MKFIHCADLHLGSKIDNIPAEKSALRRNEIVRTFERLCDYAGDNGVTAVILAGDIFDSPKVGAKLKERFFSAIEKNSQVDFLYLFGNHDADCVIKDAEDIPKNLKFFGYDWTQFRYNNVVISGVKFDGKNGAFIYDTLKLREEDKNIVVLHGQGKNYNSIDATESVNFPRLKNKNVDYLALGHIHTYEEDFIDGRCKYAFVGCLDGRGFDETGKKGFILIDTESDKLTYEFVPFYSREYCVAEFDLTNEPSFTVVRNKIVESLKSKIDKTSLIKVVLKGEIKPDFELDKELLSQILNEYFFFAKIYDKTSLKIELKDYEFDKSVSGEFVRTVLNEDLDKETADKVLVLGLKALKGEEI